MFFKNKALSCQCGRSLSLWKELPDSHFEFSLSIKLAKSFSLLRMFVEILKLILNL